MCTSGLTRTLLFEITVPAIVFVPKLKVSEKVWYCSLLCVSWSQWWFDLGCYWRASLGVNVGIQESCWRKRSARRLMLSKSLGVKDVCLWLDMAILAVTQCLILDADESKVLIENGLRWDRNYGEDYQTAKKEKEEKKDLIKTPFWWGVGFWFDWLTDMHPCSCMAQGFWCL